MHVCSLYSTLHTCHMFIVHTYYNTTTLILTHTPGRLSACAPVRTAHSAQALSVFVGKWTILERGNDTWSLEDQHLVDKKETNLEQDMGRKENGVELLTKKKKTWEKTRGWGNDVEWRDGSN